MKEAIADARKKISELQKEINNLNEFISAAQKVCPHIEWEDDHFDYHNRVDYHRCKVCGLVR